MGRGCWRRGSCGLLPLVEGSIKMAGCEYLDWGFGAGMGVGSCLGASEWLVSGWVCRIRGISGTAGCQHARRGIMGVLLGWRMVWECGSTPYWYIVLHFWCQEQLLSTSWSTEMLYLYPS